MVDRVGQNVHLDRLLAPGVHERFALVLDEVVGDSLQPSRMWIFTLRPFLRTGSQQSGKMAQRSDDLVWPHREPMIRLRAKQGRCALDRIHPAHLAAGFGW